jgi:ComF family protein
MIAWNRRWIVSGKHLAEIFGRLAGGARHLGDALLDLVYPQDCIGCGAGPIVSDGSCLCGACRAALPRIGPWQCPHCGDELGPHATGESACRSCARHKGQFFRGAAAVCRYEDVARQMVWKLKYRGDIRAVPWMGRELHGKLAEKDWFPRVEALIPVPLHWRRRVQRRFNQSELLAEAISREAGKVVLPRALQRTKHTTPQVALDRARRSENVHDVFRLRRSKGVKGKVVLLVDDVMTTCATAEACSRALLNGGAKTVYVAVYAR